MNFDLLIPEKLLYFIENGEWYGVSFYGAILFIPVLFLPAAKIFHERYGALMDLCAPAICIMLAIMKCSCMISGCCRGRLLFSDGNGGGFVFPSRIVEIVVIIGIMLLLMVFEKDEDNQTKIYPMLMMMYGGTRFFLNFFRAELSPFVWIIPPGHFWSIISVICGYLVLRRIKNKNIKK